MPGGGPPSSPLCSPVPSFRSPAPHLRYPAPPLRSPSSPLRSPSSPLRSPFLADSILSGEVCGVAAAEMGRQEASDGGETRLADTSSTAVKFPTSSSTRTQQHLGSGVLAGKKVPYPDTCTFFLNSSNLLRCIQTLFPYSTLNLLFFISIRL
jgi:hypothetical protein